MRVCLGTSFFDRDGAVGNKKIPIQKVAVSTLVTVVEVTGLSDRKFPFPSYISDRKMVNKRHALTDGTDLV